MPAGRSSADTARIFIVLPSITISWISTTPAAGDEADSSLPPPVEVMLKNAPVAFCWATVPRTQGSFTVVWAIAGRVSRAQAAAVISLERVILVVQWVLAGLERDRYRRNPPAAARPKLSRPLKNHSQQRAFS